MPLIQVDAPTFAKIREEWDQQCKSSGEEIENFAVISMQHAEKIINHGANGQDYSIFSATLDGNYDCILHVNRARLPGSDGITQKVMWVLLAPKYDFETVSYDKIARIASEIILGAIELCQKEGRSQHIKIHIGNFADREFFAGIAFGLRSVGTLENVETRGNWLHMSLAKK